MKTEQKKETITEKYIKKAVEEAKKNFSATNISDVNITMNVVADGATEKLADALLKQAEANIASSNAMLKLAQALKPIDVCGIKLTNNSAGTNCFTNITDENLDS